ncbi:M23 family metallopeptidase [Spirochaeta cellobiosiphila]|uniref:M23 family metallopeptidase n=1 Tax=Spirochaeta cellobiosiphila TaxID=504483 RepID=UPI000419E4F2|nr:M23 family metallopeptidase [Spirochaeta cellobiosiphila]
MRQYLFVFFLLATINSYSLPQEYSVKKGDTLYSIAKEFDINVEQLRFMNNLKSNVLVVGQSLLIPDTYIVKKGDTLYSISRKLNISITELYKTNPHIQNTIIKPGQTILISSSPNKATVTQKDIVISNNTLPYNGPISLNSSSRDGWIVSLNNTKEVYSSITGKVVWVGEYRGFDKVCIIEGNNGYVITYAGLETIRVSLGTRIKAGENIGQIPSNKDKLYFFSFKDGKPIDPSHIF